MVMEKHFLRRCMDVFFCSVQEWWEQHVRTVWCKVWGTLHWWMLDIQYIPAKVWLCFSLESLSAKLFIRNILFFQQYPALYSYSSSHLLLGATTTFLCCWPLCSFSGFEHCCLPRSRTSFWDQAEYLFTQSTHIFPVCPGIICSDPLLPFVLFKLCLLCASILSFMIGCESPPCMYIHCSVPWRLHYQVLSSSFIMPSSPQQF